MHAHERRRESGGEESKMVRAQKRGRRGREREEEREEDKEVTR